MFRIDREPRPEERREGRLVVGEVCGLAAARIATEMVERRTTDYAEMWERCDPKAATGLADGGDVPRRVLVARRVPSAAWSRTSRRPRVAAPGRVARWPPFGVPCAAHSGCFCEEVSS